MEKGPLNGCVCVYYCMDDDKLFHANCDVAESVVYALIEADCSR